MRLITIVVFTFFINKSFEHILYIMSEIRRSALAIKKQYGARSSDFARGHKMALRRRLTALVRRDGR